MMSPESILLSVVAVYMILLFCMFTTYSFGYHILIKVVPLVIGIASLFFVAKDMGWIVNV